MYRVCIFMAVWQFPMDVLVKKAFLQLPIQLQVCASQEEKSSK